MKSMVICPESVVAGKSSAHAESVPGLPTMYRERVGETRHSMHHGQKPMLKCLCQR